MFPDNLISPINIFGAPEGHDAAISIEFINRYQKPLIFVAKDYKRLKDFKKSLEFYSPETRVFEFPSLDSPAYSRVASSQEVISRRNLVLGKAKKINSIATFIILTTAKAITQRLPPKLLFENSIISISTQSSVNTDNLIRYLERMGYSRVPSVLAIGEYAVRGGIIDIFPTGYKNPLRIDFFGDRVDEIRQFSVEDQLTLKQIKRLELLPVTEVVLDKTSVIRFRNNFRKHFGAGLNKHSAYEAITNFKKIPGIENWLPFFYEKTELLFDYFPNAFTFFDYDVEKTIMELELDHNQLFELRNEEDQNSFDFSAKNYACPPELRYAYFNDILSSIPSQNFGFFSPFQVENDTSVINGGGKYFFPLNKRKKTDVPNFQRIINTIKQEISVKNVVIACWTKGSRDRVRQYLSDEGIQNVVNIGNANKIYSRSYQVMLAVWPLPWGFSTNTLCIISEQDIFGKQNKSWSRKSSVSKLLKEFNGLQKGELVIHEDHGIGRFEGLEVISTYKLNHDCIVLSYAKNDKLYIPVENIELITRYGQENGELDRLGGTSWNERKARVKKDLFVIADQIIQTSAERELCQASILRPDESGWDSLIARFPFVETPDQEETMKEILHDLESGKPMDRLICGDVGFGKTELAIRTAYISAIQGMQVAVLAPTTLLVAQHLKKFRERLSNFPLIIKCLTSNTPRKEMQATLKEIEEGKIDIIIGTHSLLSQKIKFSNLGLFVIDEEQNFGVVQKEKIKQLKPEVHVLSLSATPIPRTLQMAFSGVKDISLLTTPPIGRLPISTFLTEFDPILLRQALIREKQRGGQSIILVPRIKNLDNYEKFLKENVPEIKFEVAHGQLTSQELENRTTLFFNNQIDCILATSIISSGIDVPNANTIVVCDSQRFGLGQLYQIRGRVGRSTTRSYAYITYPKNEKLTDQAMNRFRIFSSLESLGAGFSLSTHDLEIRGSGNLLGEKQSGHIKLIGYELYLRMLEETVQKLKQHNTTNGKTETRESWTPKLNLGVEARIPESYIANFDTRLGIYQRLANLTEKSEIEKIVIELIDRFGPLPEEVKLFVKVIEIKGLCKPANISRLECSENGLTLWFKDPDKVNVDVLMKLLNANSQKGRVFPDRVFFKRSWKGRNTRLSEVKKYLALLGKPNSTQ